MDKVCFLGNLYREDGGTGYAGAVYHPDYLSPTLTTMQGGGRMPHILIKQATKKGYTELDPGGCFDASYPTSNTRRGRVIDRGEISPTITTDGEIMQIDKNYRIRKLTPLECFRLMGVSDKDAYKMLEVNSNSQCYKQAGNSIVVDVMVAMFRELI